MTITQFRHFLFPNAASRFSLPLAAIKERLGEPASIRFLPRDLQSDQKAIAVLSYLADDGAVELYCPVVLRDHAEFAVDGWIIVEQSVPGPEKKRVAPTLMRDLFDGVTPPPPTKPPSTAWRSGRQLNLGEGEA